MSGSQHPFPPNFGSTIQNDMRPQFGGPQRGQLPGRSSSVQSPVSIAGPQTYSVGVSIQPPTDSPIPMQQQQPPQATAQQIQQHQLHLQQRQQQQSLQQQGNHQNQQTSTGQQQNPQQNVQPQQNSGSQQVVQNINACINAGDNSIQSVPQSAAVSSGAVTTSGAVIPTQQLALSHQQTNTASLCSQGQEMVQEIVTKLEEIFSIFRTIPPPNGMQSITNRSNLDKGKFLEFLRIIKVLFKRLRGVYDLVNESSQLQGMEYMHTESLIPLKEEWDVKTSEERKTSEVYRIATEECKELIGQVIVKNALLKEIMDRIRSIIWEINTMLMMRKS